MTVNTSVIVWKSFVRILIIFLEHVLYFFPWQEYWGRICNTNLTSSVFVEKKDSVNIRSFGIPISSLPARKLQLFWRGEKKRCCLQFFSAFRFVVLPTNQISVSNHFVSIILKGEDAKTLSSTRLEFMLIIISCSFSFSSCYQLTSKISISSLLQLCFIPDSVRTLLYL